MTSHRVSLTEISRRAAEGDEQDQAARMCRLILHITLRKINETFSIERALNAITKGIDPGRREPTTLAFFEFSTYQRTILHHDSVT